MGKSVNKVILLGHAGKDPEVHILRSGTLVNLSLATSDGYKDNRGEWQERTEWHRVTVWGRRAEALGKILTKGDSIFIEGRLQTSSYEKNGEKRYSTEIVANNIVLPGRGRGDGAGASRGGGEGGGAPRRDAPARGGGGGGGDVPSEAPFDDFAQGAGSGGSEDDIPF